MPVIGHLDSGAEPNASALAAFRKGLAETGFIDGQNVAIEFRGTNQYDALPALAAELISRRVAVIFASGSPNAVLAAKSATETIPIVFANGSDPIKQGVVASLSRPGGNVTGVSFFGSTLVSKRLELLRELIPRVVPIAVLMNPTNLQSEADIVDVQTAARSVGQEVVVVRASTAAEIDLAFAELIQQRAGALFLSGDAFFTRQRNQIPALAMRHRIPAIYPARDYVVAGGLVSYGDDRLDSVRQAGRYVGRILKGEKAGDLPVLQPTKLEFVINLKAAKALGLTFPPSFHLRADEVIE
jgi:putative ABC transport system substrate-binding protein